MNRSSKRADESADVSLPSGRARKTVGARTRWVRGGRRPFIPQPAAPGSGPGRIAYKTPLPKTGRTAPRQWWSPPPIPPSPNRKNPCGFISPLNQGRRIRSRPVRGNPGAPSRPEKSRLTFHIQRKSRGKPFYINGMPCASNVQNSAPGTARVEAGVNREDSFPHFQQSFQDSTFGFPHPMWTNFAFPHFAQALHKTRGIFHSTQNRLIAGSAPVFHGFNAPYYSGYIPVRFNRKARLWTRNLPSAFRQARKANRSGK